MRWKTFKGILLFLPVSAAFVLLILRGETASSAALSGLESCLRSVIPALCPFLVLTNLLLRLEIPKVLLELPGRAFERLFRIRKTAFPAFFAGLIGGYPLGAEAAAEACRLGLCSKEEAGRLVIFANNCSPGFLFGLVSAMLPGGKKTALALLLLHWLISVCLGIALAKGNSPSKTNRSAETTDAPLPFLRSFVLSIRNGGRSALSISAYVVFFSVFTAFLPASALVRGSIELTGGILLLDSLHRPELLAAFLVGWGGLSVACQVISALDGSGISAGLYLPLRLIHGLLMALGMELYRRSAWYLPVYGTVLLMAAVIVKKSGKKHFSGI